MKVDASALCQTCLRQYSVRGNVLSQNSLRRLDEPRPVRLNSLQFPPFGSLGAEQTRCKIQDYSFSDASWNCGLKRGHYGPCESQYDVEDDDVDFRINLPNFFE